MTQAGAQPNALETLSHGIQKAGEVNILMEQAKAQLDVQVNTAKAYPRNLQQVINNIVTIACKDPETAESCFYVLRRQGAYGEQAIEGLSVRMAEIIACCWGNVSVEGYIVANDGKKVVAEGCCWDLETNVRTKAHCQRRITDKHGRTYSEDMQIVTSNAAIAIAKRNAVLSSIPRALFKAAIEQVKKVSLGQAMDIETSRTNCLASFQKLGATPEMICWYLGVENISQIGAEQIMTLRGTFTAIKEGTTTVQESIINPYNESKAEKEANKTQNKLLTAMQKQTANDVVSQAVAPEPVPAGKKSAEKKN